MSFPKTYVLTNVDEAAARIAAQGGPKLDPAQTAGTIAQDGVELGYSIEDGEITVTLLHKPWAIPESAIESRVDGFFAVKEDA